MLDTLVESQNRTVAGNRILIALRLLLATVSLAILLLQESPGRSLPLGQERLTQPGGEVNVLLFSSDGARLFSGGSDATVRIWDVASGNEQQQAIEGHGGSVRALALDPGETRLASGSNDKTVRLYNLRKGHWHWLRTLAEHDGPVTSVSWSPGGKRLLSAGGANPIRLWNPETGRLLQSGPEASQALTFAAFLPGGKEIVSAGKDGAVRFWDSRNLRLLDTIEAHIRPIQAAALSRDGRHFATAGRILRRWDVARRRQVRATEAHDGLVAAISFNGDGNRFLTAGHDKKLMLWQWDRAEELKTFGAREHPDWVLAAALSPDGKQAASGTGDRLIRLWDTQSGKKLGEWSGHRATLRSAHRPQGWQSGQTPKGAPSRSLFLRPVYLVILIVLFLTILYTLALKREELAPKLAPLQISVDLGLISALVYHTGGVDSPFVTLYLVSVVAAAFVLSWRAAVMMAALAATLFSLLTLSYGLGHIPETYAFGHEAQLRKFSHMSLLDYVRLLLLPVCAFFLISVLSGYLSRSLAVARLLHHEILEGIGEGILVLDTQAQVVYHNREIGRMLGLTEKLERRPLKALLNESIQEQAAKVLAECSGRRLELVHKRPDGLIIPFEVRIIPVVEKDEPPRGLIVVVDDITAEKKMEELFKHKERIETMGQISATIAHEIRNPLASIRGAVQEIARSVEIPENKKILIEIVLSESDRLDQIITDFLKYARMRAPRIKEVDLTELLRGLRLMLVARPEAKEIEITLEASDDIPPFLADSEQLRQVFFNLGINAMQAVAGRPRQRIEFRLHAAPLHKTQGLDKKLIAQRLNRPGVLVEVRDTGPGLPPESRDEIFEPFFTTKPNGTGLGLAIVDRIVQGHGGAVGVSSEHGVGTTITIWLPTDLKPQRQASSRRHVRTISR